MNESRFKYGRGLNIIVQAGGKGSRLRHHTWNKPKCLVPIDGKPVLYHLFSRFPEARFCVVSDHLHEVLESYLAMNPPNTEVRVLKTSEKGTCAGISEAASYFSEDYPVLVVWSDLLIHEIGPPSDCTQPSIYLTNEFVCRWRVVNGVDLVESPASHDGVLGLFFFPSPMALRHVPQQGEFVKHLKQSHMRFTTTPIYGAKEMGDFTELQSTYEQAITSRPFNHVSIDGDLVTKTASPEYQHLINAEVHWYQTVSPRLHKRLPRLIESAPLVISRLPGAPPDSVPNMSEREKGVVLREIFYALSELHSIESSEVNRRDVDDMYVAKTVERVASVARVNQLAQFDEIVVNGIKCKNIFKADPSSFIRARVDQFNIEKFTIIHGDPTFSNTLVDERLFVRFIDPRGTFGSTPVFGDPYYDFAKVYYSAVGGYDHINRKNFKVFIRDNSVEVLTPEPVFSQSLIHSTLREHGIDVDRVQFLTGLIFLSLTGYAKDDIDTILAAFALGLRGVNS